MAGHAALARLPVSPDGDAARAARPVQEPPMFRRSAVFARMLTSLAVASALALAVAAAPVAAGGRFP